MSWVKLLSDHGYANTDTLVMLSSEQVSGNWMIRANGGSTSTVLAGTYADQAAADAAIRALTNGVTVADLI